jgi:hypothetical protein
MTNIESISSEKTIAYERLPGRVDGGPIPARPQNLNDLSDMEVIDLAIGTFEKLPRTTRFDPFDLAHYLFSIGKEARVRDPHRGVSVPLLRMLLSNEIYSHASGSDFQLFTLEPTTGIPCPSRTSTNGAYRHDLEDHPMEFLFLLMGAGVNLNDQTLTMETKGKAIPLNEYAKAMLRQMSPSGELAFALPVVASLVGNDEVSGNAYSSNLSLEQLTMVATYERFPNGFNFGFHKLYALGALKRSGLLGKMNVSTQSAVNSYIENALGLIEASIDKDYRIRQIKGKRGQVEFVPWVYMAYVSYCLPVLIGEDDLSRPHYRSFYRATAEEVLKAMCKTQDVASLAYCYKGLCAYREATNGKEKGDGNERR